MAEAMTYSSLIEDVQTYAERTDSTFVDQVPRFVMLAENRIASEIHGLGFKRVVTQGFVIGDPIIEKPARWRETLEFSYLNAANERVYLFQRSYGYLRTYAPDQSVLGSPAYYADYDYEHFLVVPTPDAARVFELHYHERPKPLDITIQTNWTTQYAPQILLYATLLEAQPFLMRSERTQEFMSLYQAAVQALGLEFKVHIGGDQTNSRTEG